MMQELEIVREKLQSKYRVVKTDEDLEWNRAIDLCTNIINAHIKHMNDGWIPVEERLPEVFGKYWATIRYDDGRISEPIVVDFRGVRQKYVVDTPNGREYETWGIDSAFHGSRVIAWRPYYIPEPYRSERSESKAARELGKEIISGFEAGIHQGVRENEVAQQPTAFEKIIKELKGEIELVVHDPMIAGRYIKKSRAIEIVEKGEVK